MSSPALETAGAKHVVVAVEAKQAPLSNFKFSPALIALTRDFADYIFVLLDEKRQHVRFLQNGYEIKRCGSGTLAAAACSLHRRARYPQQPIKYLNLVSPAESLTIRTAPSMGGGTALAYAANPLRYAALPLNCMRAWQRCLNVPLRCAWLVGGSTDYIALLAANTRLLKKASLALHIYRRLSERSVILMAPCYGKHDYLLRYFSPLYGVPEARVSASAHAVVASYWQKALKKPSVKGLQWVSGLSQKMDKGQKSAVVQSQAGRQFAIDGAASLQWVTGRVRRSAKNERALMLADALNSLRSLLIVP